jgi:hypothetical protein
VARLGFILLAPALGTGCGGSGQEGVIKPGDVLDINNDGFPDGKAVDSDGDGNADSIDLDGDGIGDGRFPWLPPLSNEQEMDGGSTEGDGDTGDGDDDTGDGDDDTPGDGDDDTPGDLDITIPLAKVPCGKSECAIRDDKICCGGWDPGTGFLPNGSSVVEEMCVTDDACFWTPNAEEGFDDEGLYSMTLGGPLVGKPRGVSSSCDGSEDCKETQVCCYVRVGVPMGSPDAWTGPGAGRQCMDLKNCMDVGTANGVPTGVVSCNDDGDCAMVAGTKCQPEQDNTATTGANVKARANYKVCR